MFLPKSNIQSHNSPTFCAKVTGYSNYLIHQERHFKSRLMSAVVQWAGDIHLSSSYTSWQEEDERRKLLYTRASDTFKMFHFNFLFLYITLSQLLTTWNFHTSYFRGWRWANRIFCHHTDNVVVFIELYFCLVLRIRDLWKGLRFLVWRIWYIIEEYFSISFING